MTVQLTGYPNLNIPYSRFRTPKGELSWQDRDSTFVGSERYYSWYQRKGEAYTKNLDVTIRVEEDNRGVHCGETEPADNDRLNFIVTCNITADPWRPLTPWICCHRFYHTIQLGGELGMERRFKYDCFPLVKKQEEAWRDYTREYVNEQNKSTGAFTGYKSPIPIAHEICTFKAARDKAITGNLDIYADLFAQWMLKGTVEFTVDDPNINQLRDETNAIFQQLYETLQGRTLIF